MKRAWRPAVRMTLSCRYRNELRVLALEGEREASFEQGDRILAEDLVAPAMEHVDVALAGGEAVDLVGARDQAGGNAGLLGLEPQQGAQQVDHRTRRTELLGS